MLRTVRELADARAGAADTDCELLRRFAAGRDEQAFAQLMRRHGPLVWGVCQRALRHEQDAEDAFQATFLVLAARAGSQRWDESVGSWLYEVAWRAAARVRGQRPRLAEAGEEPAAPKRDPAGALESRDTCAAVAEELRKLPEKYRLPLLLCCLEGSSRSEAARQLGWKEGTVAGRLARARDLLHGRLVRRGIVVPAGIAVLVPEGATAGVPAALVTAAVRHATLAATGRLAALDVPDAAAVARALLRGAVVTRLKAAAVLVVLGLAAAGAGLYARQARIEDGDEPRPKASAPSREAVERTDWFGDPLPPGALVRLGTVRFRHGDRVNALAFSPTGKTLASASQDGILHFWEAATGRDLRQLALADRPGPVFYSVSFSADGSLLVSGGGGRDDVSVLDAGSGREIRVLKRPEGVGVGNAVITPDGRTVAAGADHHRVVLWDVASGQVLRTLRDEQTPKDNVSLAACVAFAPDGRTLASAASRDLTVILWEVATGAELRRFRVPAPEERQGFKTDPNRLINHIAFSPDGKLLATCGSQQEVHLWEVSSGKEVRQIPGGSYGTVRVAFSPDGRLLATGETESGVRLWEVATGKEVAQLAARGSWGLSVVNGLAFSPDGQILAAGSDAVIRLWDVRTKKELRPDAGHAAGITQIQILSDGKRAVTAGHDGTIRHWDLETGREQKRTTLPGRFQGVSVSPDGRTAVAEEIEQAGANHGRIHARLWDVSSLKDCGRLGRPSAHASGFSPDGKRVFLHSYDTEERAATLAEWDVETATQRRVLAKFKTGIEKAVLSSDASTWAIATRQRKTHIVDAASGKERQTFDLQTPFSLTPALSPDGRLLAAAENWRPFESRVFYQHLHVWDAGTGRKLRQFGRLESEHGYHALSFSPDGRTLASAGPGSQLRLWEVATGAERLTLVGHAGQAHGLHFIAGGRRLVTTGEDTTALVWDVTAPPSSGEQAPDAEALWADLASADAARTYRAVWALARLPDRSVDLLARHLRPVAAPEPGVVLQLVRDLDSPTFAVRQRTTTELTRLGHVAGPALREALAGRPGPELRQRLQQLVAQLDGEPTGEELRAIRAVEVLEHLATPSARTLLKTLADGAAEATLTREAQQSLRRLTAGPRE